MSRATDLPECIAIARAQRSHQGRSGGYQQRALLKLDQIKKRWRQPAIIWDFELPLHPTLLSSKGLYLKGIVHIRGVAPILVQVAHARLILVADRRDLPW